MVILKRREETPLPNLADECSYYIVAELRYGVLVGENEQLRQGQIERLCILCPLSMVPVQFTSRGKRIILRFIKQRTTFCTCLSIIVRLIVRPIFSLFSCSSNFGACGSLPMDSLDLIWRK